jgi:hypothetical protein
LTEQLAPETTRLFILEDDPCAAQINKAGAVVDPDSKEKKNVLWTGSGVMSEGCAGCEVQTTVRFLDKDGKFVGDRLFPQTDLDTGGPRGAFSFFGKEPLSLANPPAGATHVRFTYTLICNNDKDPPSFNEVLKLP